MMTIGAGKYDEECTHARNATQGDITALIVVNGTRGSGFSVQATDPLMLLRLPEILEILAKQIRADMAQGQL